MKVKNVMTDEVFTVGPEESVDRVFFLLHFEKIRHLPVVSRGKVVGIVSDRDLYKALGPRSRRRNIEKTDEEGTRLYVIPRKVRHIMRRGVITIEPADDLGRAAATMKKRRIGALPVVHRNKLVGIITATDVLGAFAKHAAKCPQL